MPTDFGLTDEQEAFRAALREFGAKELAPHYRSDDVAGRMRPELPAALPGMGLTGLRIPERFGGQEADAVTTGMRVGRRPPGPARPAGR